MYIAKRDQITEKNLFLYLFFAPNQGNLTLFHLDNYLESCRDECFQMNFQTVTTPEYINMSGNE